MTAPDQQPSRNRRQRQALGLVESAGSDHQPSGDATVRGMAVSIAGVSTACSKDALMSSAKAVRKTLAPE